MTALLFYNFLFLIPAVFFTLILFKFLMFGFSLIMKIIDKIC